MAEAGHELLTNPAASGLAGALGTAALAWLGQRLVGKAAIQEAINKSFHELMDQLRQELRVAIRERDEARRHLAEAEARVEELTATISALEVRIASCTVLPRC